MNAEPEIVTDDIDMFEQVGKPAGQVASVATAYEDRQITTGRIWIWFAENGNIRKWSAEPFEEGTEYVVATALAAKAARIAELIAADEVRARDISRLTVERDASRAECEGLRAALEEILDTMRRRAAETGRRLDGAIANTLANDANHLKQIARAALSRKETGDE